MKIICGKYLLKCVMQVLLLLILFSCANQPSESAASESVMWPSANDGFVVFGKDDYTVSYMLVSELPKTEVSYTCHSSVGWAGVYIRLYITPLGKDQVTVQLTSETLVIFISKRGEVFTRVCPVSIKEFQQMEDSLISAETVPGTGRKNSINIIKSFVKANPDRPWPAELLEFIRSQ